MKNRAYIATLAAFVVAAFGTSAAQAHVLFDDSSVNLDRSQVGLSTLYVMQKAGTSFHATARTAKSSTASRPDNRSGRRGI